MQKGCSPVVFLLLALIVGVLAYFLGKKNGTKSIDSLAMNNSFVQQIAELSALEVQGVASIKSTNIANDGSLADAFKKIFTERTFNIAVPYIAKYGVDLSKQKVNIEAKNHEVYIVLPEPQLLSYELRLDKADASVKKGLLEDGNEEAYNKVMKKLYLQSKTQLENNNAYKQQSREKIKKVIEDYYAPLNLKVDIKFSSELKSKVIEQPLQ